MEYCDRSLEQKFTQMNLKPMPMSLLKSIVGQMFEGLSQMHEKGVTHRDLKPENILLQDDRVKIADLGTSKALNKLSTPYVVSRFYRPPELILGSRNYGSQIDLWSAGCILFELLARTPLFPGESEGMQLYEFV